MRPALAEVAGPWWVIGSGAMVLHGVPGIIAHDLDIILDSADAAMLCDKPATTGTAGGFVRLPPDAGVMFVSKVYARRSDLPLMVEIMGGFAIRATGGPRFVRLDAPVIRSGWPVASLTDLRRMCHLFDRPKDRLRLRALEASHPG